jgi:mannose-6-phosphate isomerase
MDEIASYLQDLSLPALNPQLSRFVDQPSSATFKLLYNEIFTLSTDAKNELLRQILSASEQKTFGEDECRWIITLNDYYPGDVGILSVLLLNLVHIDPGQAVATRAGELHAYLQGVGAELMANSDNVLRGGLTTKHTDINELIKIVDFSESEVKIIYPEPNSAGLRCYKTDSEEFLLASLTLQKTNPFKSDKSHGIEIWILLEGQVSLVIESSQTVKQIKKGESFLVPAFLGNYTIEGEGYLFRASIPPLNVNQI